MRVPTQVGKCNAAENIRDVKRHAGAEKRYGQQQVHSKRRNQRQSHYIAEVDEGLLESEWRVKMRLVHGL